MTATRPLSARVHAAALLLAVGGVAVAVGSLWLPWAVGDVDYGPVPRESGWAWMTYGDVLLVVTGVVIVGLVASVVGRKRRVHAIGLGLVALVLTICAALGVLVIASLTTVSFTDFDTVDYRVGSGATVAIGGLVAVGAGVVTAILGVVPHDHRILPRSRVPWPHFRHAGPRTGH